MNKDDTNIFYILGMSPGNSHFNDNEVKSLINKVVDEHDRVAVLIADIPAISTYIALGYKENRARRDKAIPQGNALRNRVERAVEELGLREDQVRIIDWGNEVEENMDYKKHYSDINNLYNSNKDFQKEVDDTTKAVLDGSGKKIEDINKAVKIAMHYLLSEIAFLEFAPKLLNVNKIVYVYHKDWIVYEDYIVGKFDGRTREKMGFLLIKENVNLHL